VTGTPVDGRGNRVGGEVAMSVIVARDSGVFVGSGVIVGDVLSRLHATLTSMISMKNNPSLLTVSGRAYSGFIALFNTASPYYSISLSHADPK
jgi:hypothetical protein